MAEIGSDLEKAKRLLVAGELVAIPTETVYGLAGDALNISAVTKIFAVKERPQFDPLIVHVPDLKAAAKYTSEIPDQAKNLAHRFWPGPLTLLLKRNSSINDLVTSGLETVGLRCPDHELTQALLHELPFPLAAPSANPFGYISPTRVEHVQEQLGNQIPYILDGGPSRIGVESTIVGFENEMPVIFRLGGISLEQIEVVAGTPVVRTYSTSNPKSPGQLNSHYAPRKKLVLGNITELIKVHKNKKYGILSYQQDFGIPYQFILSATGKSDEAAQNLFSALRDLDKMPIEIIIAEPVPDVGLGRAINDRLRRASR